MHIFMLILFLSTNIFGEYSFQNVLRYGNVAQLQQFLKHISIDCESYVY